MPCRGAAALGEPGVTNVDPSSAGVRAIGGGAVIDFAARIYNRLAMGPSATARADCADIAAEADAEIARLRAEVALLRKDTPKWQTLTQAEPADQQLCAVHAEGAAFCPFWPARWDAAGRIFDAGGGWFEQSEVSAWIPMPEPAIAKEVK